MGMNNADAGALVFDLETLPIEGAASYLEPIEAPSNYVNADAIDRYIAKATLKAAEDCSVDPDLCRIAVLGLLLEGQAEPMVRTAANENDERLLLSWFWNTVSLDGGGHRRTISFYGLSFDWPVIIQRSRYLDVRFAMPNLDKYRTPHTDLHAKLTFNGATHKTHSLDFFAKRFKLALPEDPIDGSKIAAVLAAGQWATAIQHCRVDVLRTAGLARRCGFMSSQAEAAEAAEAVF